MKIALFAVGCFISLCVKGQIINDWYPAKNYTKMEVMIPMRDGVKLFTSIYIPKDSSQQYPFLMERTPYSVSPYGLQNYATSLGPNPALMAEKYIFVYQDVRGRYMSEGHNLEMTPYIEHKKNKNDVDESSDTYDTIDWLLKNIKNNNGRVGLYGISYPGFYATASLPGAHPAIKAVSPQAPVTDEFIGDDANHNGAFFLLDNFDFMNYFGKKREGPVEDYGSNMFRVKRQDAYQFFLNLGPVKNTQSSKYFNHESYIWNEYLEHDTYDSYWRNRNIRPHLKNIKIPVLVVGGWFDAEDLFGALHTYEAIEKQSPVNSNYLVMGPWTHGAWEDEEWRKFGTYSYNNNINEYFNDSIETKFFNYYLKDKGSFNASEATVFETGTDEWKHFEKWPPANMHYVDYFLDKNHNLSTNKDLKSKGYDEYISDPSNPVPYTNGTYSRRNNQYMVEDQRFAAQRPDVVFYETDILSDDVTLAGKIVADLFVSITSTDADFIVKITDVLPPNEINAVMPLKDSIAGGFERLVRAEVMRGKFRDSYEKPQPFVPGKISEVKITLNDVLHTFKKGHRIMVQVQSSWFPLVDMNPQKFLRIPDANKEDFQKAIIKVYHNSGGHSKIMLPVLQN
jgi:putative CocE/NonD family hydrolase